MQDLDLRTLEIFRALATEGSVSGAARRLNRVQSNVSTRMKQLEERLDKVLFRRRKHGVVLTPDGELLLDYAQRLLDLSEEASDALSRDIPRGTLRVGTMEATAASRLPQLLARYHAAYPEVSLDLVTGTSGSLLQKLTGHEVDIAFVAEPVSHDELETMPFATEALILVVPGSFGAEEKLSALSGRAMIAFEQGCAYRRYLEDWLLEVEVTPGTVHSVGSYLAMLACVSAGAGFCVIPKSVLDVIGTGKSLLQLPLGGRYERVQTLMACRKGYRSAKFSALKALAGEL